MSVVSLVERRKVKDRVFEIYREKNGYIVRVSKGPWIRVKTLDDVEEEIRFWSTRRGM